MNTFRDKVAEAIRADGTDLCDRPWDQLPDEMKEGWRGDADRAIDIILAEVIRVVTDKDEDKPANWKHRREDLPSAIRFALLRGRGRS